MSAYYSTTSSGTYLTVLHGVSLKPYIPAREIYKVSQSPNSLVVESGLLQSFVFPSIRQRLSTSTHDDNNHISGVGNRRSGSSRQC
jgi:hypothetical protein